MSSVKILDSIDYEFLTGFQHAMHSVTVAATDLAYYLAYITLAFTTIMLLLKGEEINKLLSKLLQCCLLFGIFFGMIKLCGSWVPMWINSFMQLGGKAGDLQGLDPSSIFDQGFVISSTIVHTATNLGLTHIPTALLAMICSIFIVIIYGFIAAHLAVTIIKAYALVTVGPIIFALGMNDVTRSTVTNYISKLIGMGLNLLMLYIIIGVGVHVGQDWVTNIQQSAASGSFDYSAILVVVGGLIIFYLVVQNVPSFIAEISGAGGFRDYGQATIAAAMAAASTTATAMKGGALAPTSLRNAGAAVGGSVSTAGRGLGNVAMGGAQTLGAVGSAFKATPGIPKAGVNMVKDTSAAFKSGGAMAGGGALKDSVASAFKPFTDIAKPAVQQTAKAFKPK